jgi:glyoxylase-like metal-dependent hydrolase (beta-lactamase superfamily II)
VILFGPTELADPDNPVLISPLPPAHSRGDSVITLKHHNLVHVGGLLVTDRNPWAGDADVGGWLTSLNAIAKQNPAVIVGVRGAAVDSIAIRQQRDGLAWIRGQVEATFIEKLPREAVVPRVLAAEGLERHFDLTVRPSFVEALIERSLEESWAQRRKRGVN